MPILDLRVDGEGMLNDVPFDKIINIETEVRVGGLVNGMDSGKPSVGISAMLPDGRAVLIQTSLSLFLMAADVLKAHYGDPRQEIAAGAGKTIDPRVH
jgi:hypothetical protein